MLAALLAIPFFFRRTIGDAWHQLRGDSKAERAGVRRVGAHGALTEPSREPASFRDPSGQVFRRDGVLTARSSQLARPIGGPSTTAAWPPA